MPNVYNFNYSLKGNDTRKTKVRVGYYTVQTNDEFDIVVDFVRENGNEIKFNLAEKMELHKAALNDYFNHQAE